MKELCSVTRYNWFGAREERIPVILIGRERSFTIFVHSGLNKVVIASFEPMAEYIWSGAQG